MKDVRGESFLSINSKNISYYQTKFRIISVSLQVKLTEIYYEYIISI